MSAFTPKTSREDLFLLCSNLQYRNKMLKQELDEFKSGARYIKLQADYRRVVAGFIREIQRLRAGQADANARAITVRDLWYEECEGIWKAHEADMEAKDKEIERLTDKIWEVYQKCDEELDRQARDYEEKISERDAEIEALRSALAHAEALLGRDSSNTNLPTSKTPLDKEKRIPNTRVKSGRKKGGQPGHEKHTLPIPDDDEITDEREYKNEDEDFLCPSCGSNKYVPTGEYEDRYEFDIEINVRKVRHRFYFYGCTECGEIFALRCPPNLRGEVQYGSTLQALALSLTNTVNAAMNKTSMFLEGISGGELTPCEGYVAKLQKRAAKNLVQFRQDLKLLLITLRIVYWDDTVIMITTQRGCFRFYGDEHIAYYTAHEKKDMAGIDEDNVLALLTPETFVMHDHNTLNYNKKFNFENLECNQHGERDCQKNSDDTQHKWSAKTKKLIGTTIKARNEAADRGETSFSDSYIKAFHKKIDEYISEGWEENEKDKNRYGAVEERRLLRRINKYRRNYFRWLEDFSLPTTNNLSERSLRSIKSHMKISGQFESVEAADNHALIKTYTETCRRNGINEIIALQRLCEGNPYTVQEIFSKSPPQK